MSDTDWDFQPIQLPEMPPLLPPDLAAEIAAWLNPGIPRSILEAPDPHPNYTNAMAERKR